MSSNEILSLQFGHYSNFVGAHWWNIQESSFKYGPDALSDVNHDVLYREGRTLKGELTFTPRLLLVDLKGSLKSLPAEGDLYNVPEDSNVYPENVEVRNASKIQKNSFQKDLEQGTYQSSKNYDFDNEVQVWSDYLYPRFHPRTVNIVNEYQHDNEHTSFDIYPLGTSLWKTEQFCEDFADKIRNYVEECNHFQGFHTILDSTDGFAGLSSSCMEYLTEEYATKSILSFPINTHPEDATPVHLLNLALCFEALSEHCSLFVPLSPPTQQFDFLSYRPTFPYHTSAILAAALDTSTLVYRLKKSHHSLLDLCTDFSINGRKAAAASVCLPFPIKKNEDFIDCLDNWSGALFKSLTPDCEINTDKNLHLISLRGIPEVRLKRPPHISTKQRDMPAYKCNSIKEMLDFYMDCTSYASKSKVITSEEQMVVSNIFPKIFDRRITTNGDVDVDKPDNTNVNNINVLSGFHSGTMIGNTFDVLSKNLDKIKYKQLHQFTSEGVEHDQIKECFDHLLDFRDCYNDNNYLI